MKMWIARDCDNTLWIFEKYPIKKEKLFYPKTDITGRFTYYRSLPTDIFPEVTFENSPMEVELVIKHSGMHFSPMFRLLDRLVIKDSSDRRWIVEYTKKLIDKLKEEGFDADVKLAEEYLKVFNGELVEIVVKK